MDASPERLIASSSRMERLGRLLFLFSLTLGGVLGFLILLSAMAGAALGATTDDLTTDISVGPSTESTASSPSDSEVSLDATASEDGAVITASSPMVSADATVRTNEVVVSSTSRAISADATVTTKEVNVSATSSIVSADANVTGANIEVSAKTPILTTEATVRLDGEGLPTIDLGVDQDALASPAIDTSEESADPARTSTASTVDGSGNLVGPSESVPQIFEFENAFGTVTRASGPYPGNPIAPPSPEWPGASPAPPSFGSHTMDALMTRTGLTVLFALLWYLVLAGFRVPRRNRVILALPG